MIKCSECGYENMDGLDYCDGCGAKLTASAGAAAGAASPAGAAAPAAEAAAAESAEHQQPAAGAPSGEAHAIEASQTPPPAENSAGTSNANAATAEEASRAPTGEIKPETAATPAEPAAALTYKAKLAIIRGGRRGQEFELESGNNLVGRWDPETGSFPEVDLDADDPEAKISRKHALIRLDGSKITIEDIGSLNGTYVNRQPRLQPGNPVDLKDGDEIIIGKTFLKLSVNPIS